MEGTNREALLHSSEYDILLSCQTRLNESTGFVCILDILEDHKEDFTVPCIRRNLGATVDDISCDTCIQKWLNSERSIKL